MVCVDLYTDKPRSWFKYYDISEVDGKYGLYYKAKIEETEKEILTRRARKSGIKFRIYSEKWERGINYRQKFIEANQGPYRCRYCGKKLTVKEMTVDHIIPIDKAKSGGAGRRHLTIKGIQDVNDIRNLVASCKKCNKKKDNHIGFWYLKGALGYKKYRLLLVGIITIVIITLGVMYKYTNFFGLKDNIFFQTLFMGGR